MRNILLAFMLAQGLTACASVSLDRQAGADRALMRNVAVLQAQSAVDQAGAECAGSGAGARDACVRRDQLTADLRDRGYCLQAASNDRAYAVWTACGARRS